MKGRLKSIPNSNDVKMKYIQEVEDLNSLRALVVEDLKELGIKASKGTKCKTKEEAHQYQESAYQGLFGCPLDRLPCLLIDGCGFVPKFLIDAIQLLEAKIETEGIFRKSGSIARQKELRERFEEGRAVTDDAHPLDVAGLIKTFFRELPEPLLTCRLHDAFLKCHTLEASAQRTFGLLMVCLLLPWPHLCTLRYMMLFLGRVASLADINKMDVPNLAVCLAPNFISTAPVNGTKPDKMTGLESKMLEVQRCIIEMLIENAEQIGMVSESLAGRVVLLGQCFPGGRLSEDELDKSGSIQGILDDTTDASQCKKKKKRRSGSLQGFVSNLSSSFTRWRRTSGHNASQCSEKSTCVSMVSDAGDQSVISGDSESLDGLSLDTQSVMSSQFTPKLVRKRKASNEMIPFSATKKMAILQSMPHSAALPMTPFTPRTKSMHDFNLDTPSFKFTDGGHNINFNATPHPTSKQIPHKILTPQSSVTKVKRHMSTKGCFSQTPKTKRRGVKGFLRRLSGSKDIKEGQAGSGCEEDNDSAVSDSGSSSSQLPAQPALASPALKKKGFFKRHRKTPSSPARLGNGHLSRADLSGENPEATRSNMQSMTNLQIASGRQVGVSSRGYHQRGQSAEGLRRGKPNTVASGLPSDRYQPSPDRSRHSLERSQLGPPRHSSQRDIFHSPECVPRMAINGGVIDTSPIIGADMSPCFHGRDESDTDDDHGGSVSASSSRSSLTSGLLHMLSSASLLSQRSCLSDHDRAFIHDVTVSEATEEHRQSTVNVALPSASSTSTQCSTMTASACIPAPLPPTAFSPTGLSTLLLRPAILSPTTLPPANRPANRPNSCITLPDKSVGCVEETAKNVSLPVIVSPQLLLTSTCSTDSIDSAIDPGAPVGHITPHLGMCESHHISSSPDIHKSTSTASVKSYDSGLGEERANARHALSLVHWQAVHDISTLQLLSGVESQAHIIKPLSILKRPKVSVGNEMVEKHTSPLRFHNAVSRQRRGASPVRIPTIFAKADADAEKYRSLAKASLTSQPSMRSRFSQVGEGNPLPPPQGVEGDCPLTLERKPRSRQPRLPISTNLVRGHMVEAAASEQGDTDSTITDSGSPALATPSKRPNFTDLANNDALGTPHIKPLLMCGAASRRTGSTARPSGQSLALTRNGQLATPRARSPVKPVKRLQGSPHSPGSLRARSPKNMLPTTNKKGKLSPIPSHVSNWDF